MVIPAALLSLLAVPQMPAPVEVPFHLGEDAIVVDARVNGRPVSLMVDTGFGGSIVLDNSIDVGKATGHITLRDFVGEIDAETVKVKSLALGAMHVDPAGMEVVLQPRGNYSASYGTHCDGILGLEILKSNVVEIDFEHNKFIFLPKSTDLNKRAPDNTRTFLTKLLPIGTDALVMPVTLSNGKTLTMALDSGNAFYATTHRDVLERVGIWDSGRTPKFVRLSGVASGPVESWSAKMPPLSIFGVPVKETVWDVIELPASSAEADGTVGFGFLRNFNITFDFERRRVWFEKWHTPIEGNMPGDLGISAVYETENKRTVVARVAPDSPAEKAGVKRGDTLLSIDRTDFSDFGPRRLRQLLEGPIGSKASLATSRAGTLRRVNLVREALVN